MPTSLVRRAICRLPKDTKVHACINQCTLVKIPPQKKNICVALAEVNVEGEYVRFKKCLNDRVKKGVTLIVTAKVEKLLY